MMANGTGQQRPLSELSPVAQRRNSPIWNQNTKKMASSSPSSRDGSPFGASASMRLYWKGRDSPSNQGSENRQPYGPEAALQTSRRASLENLKRVSRVRNSRIIAREQNNENDPPQASSPQRPLAAGRLSQKVNQNDVVHETQQVAANDQPNDDIATENVARPASRDQASPAKSSLSKGSRFGQNATSFDPETEIWLDGQRHLKSVTFDAAPPQINEYEMSTPDPSTIASGSHDGSYDSEEDEGEISFDQDSSIDRDDSFDASLEDVEKTPVVLPEDWRFMSPDSENDEVVHQEDVENHDGDSPEHSRVEGQDSNSERRPLPPLPSTRMLASSRPSSAGMPSSGLDQADIKQRALPPRPGSAPYGQFDGSKLKEAMSLEDKLRLMALGENAQENERSDSAEGNEEHMAKENNSTTDEHTKEDTQMMKTDDHAGSGMGGLDRLDVDSPRISRESILRDIRKGDSFSDDSFEYSSQVDSSIQHYDPDVAIPSVEDENEDTNASVDIKDEENDDEDVYAIPDYYDDHHDENHAMGNEHYADDDNQSQYSRDSALEYQEQTAHHSNASDDSQTTAIAAEQSENHADRKFANTDKQEPHNEDAAAPETPERPETPPGRVDNPPNNEPSTPDSVIRHSAERDDSPPKESVPDPVATVKAPGGKLKTRPSLTPADMASMAATRRKISGQHDPPMPPLEKQPSNESQKSENSNASPDHKKDPLQDAPQLLPSAKNERQRQSSLVKLDIPFSIQEESLGFGLDKEFDRVIETQKVAFEQALSQIQPKIPSALAATHARQPRNPQETNHDSSGLAADPPIPKQRGYLMRQNTKVIVASSDADDVPAPPGDGTPAAAPGPRPGPTPRKPSQQTWTKVPWNSQPRRSSIKMGGSAIPRKKPVAGPVPPLPGQKSNVQDAQEAIAAAEENDPALNQTFEEGEERGRMFVKVVGIKYLDLPLPKGERSYFALTLDNGLHCVTTSWLELGKSAPIGQEFELIVQNDLEFQLTLQMKVDDSKFKAPEAAAPSPSRQKASTLSRVFASPRKRKEMELKNQMMQQQQREIDPNPGIWDKLRTLIAPDGSFGRSYVALSDHEKNAFGRPYTFDVSCFNEWAADDQMSSVKSKKSTTSNCSQRRPPYKIGKLELQLLFVPRPKGAKDEDMPKSMNACIREMRDAENVASRSFEGFLSQQGGDCPYWRRRFFKLQGSKLTAFHETSRQPRATINLAKAAKLIDDKSILTQRETSTRGGGRRKSAFAEEEEGYMFVEEGFRIRFGNGEVIDFYADSATEKENWMNVLADAVGKGSSSTSSQAKAWTEVVLKHEKHMQAKRDAGVLPARPLGNGGGAGPVRPATPSTPRKDAGPSPAPGSAAFARSPAQAQPPASFLPRPGHKHAYSQPEARSVDTRKQKTRSLLF